MNCHSGRTKAIEHLLFTNVHTSHVVAHLREYKRNCAHAGPADADHVEPLESGEIEGRQWLNGCSDCGRWEVGSGAHGMAQARAIDSTKPANAPLRCNWPIA